MIFYYSNFMNFITKMCYFTCDRGKNTLNPSNYSNRFFYRSINIIKQVNIGRCEMSKHYPLPDLRPKYGIFRSIILISPKTAGKRKKADLWKYWDKSKTFRQHEHCQQSAVSSVSSFKGLMKKSEINSEREGIMVNNQLSISPHGPVLNIQLFVHIIRNAVRIVTSK